MVAVIGDGGVAAGSSKYVLAREVGRVLCERGFRIVTVGSAVSWKPHRSAHARAR
jgi:hypothetical protein